MPGTIRRRSGIFVAPEPAISSAVITNIAEATRESFCSFFETEVTSTFIRSSRLWFARSFDFCCDRVGTANIARPRGIRPVSSHGTQLTQRRKVWLLFWRSSFPIGLPFTRRLIDRSPSRESRKAFGLARLKDVLFTFLQISSQL